MCQTRFRPSAFRKETKMSRIADEIKARVTTRQLCELVGLKVDRRGEALCPFHGDSNKSLRVYSDPARGWYCFGCHRGGTVIDFAMEWYGIDFQQALIRLDADFDLGLPLQRRMTGEEKKAYRRERLEQEKQKKEALNAQYAAESSFWKAHGLYCDCLSTIEIERPKRPSDAFSDAYAEALKLRPILRDELEFAQYTLEKAREEVLMVGTGTKGSAA